MLLMRRYGREQLLVFVVLGHISIHITQNLSKHVGELVDGILCNGVAVEVDFLEGRQILRSTANCKGAFLSDTVVGQAYFLQLGVNVLVQGCCDLLGTIGAELVFLGKEFLQLSLGPKALTDQLSNVFGELVRRDIEHSQVGGRFHERLQYHSHPIIFHGEITQDGNLQVSRTSQNFCKSLCTFFTKGIVADFQVTQWSTRQCFADGYTALSAHSRGGHNKFFHVGRLLDDACSFDSAGRLQQVL
mmetsp:Transcript_5551/g.16557  ORF Transcript_5551/g.16557 Transcript_5551/m.16557 type:complete len:245 (+) Transcript_5551:156-890(+)